MRESKLEVPVRPRAASEVCEYGQPLGISIIKPTMSEACAQEFSFLTGAEVPASQTTGPFSWYFRSAIVPAMVCFNGGRSYMEPAV